MAMAGLTRAFYWLLAAELVTLMLCFSAGVIVGAFSERLSRRFHPHARIRNIIIKVAIAYVSAAFIPGYATSGTVSGHEGKSRDFGSWMLVSFVMRVIIFTSGSIVGAALQPVGLTGGIATGKSTVSSLLQSPPNKDVDGVEMMPQFVIIDLDRISHDILLPKELVQNESVYDRVVSEFGTDILSKNEGENASVPIIDRRKLGDLVFTDKQKRRKLNSITHPKIILIMLKRILIEGLRLSKQKTDTKLRVVCVDIPLLYEGGLMMRLLFGNVIVVACNSTLQLERLRKRNPDLTLDQCRQRITSQIPLVEKERKADVVLRNDGSLKSLQSQVRQVKSQLTNIVAGPQRGVELSWLVVGFAGLRFWQLAQLSCHKM
jgi:dephospho-CoA kinase